MTILRISHADMRMLRLHLDSTRKIAAIKVVRNGADCSLIAAKQAVERYAKENNYPGYHNSSIDGYPRIVAGCSIKSIDLDFGNGTVTVDLEGMELKALREIESLGIETVRDILDLVEGLKRFENGERFEG